MRIGTRTRSPRPSVSEAAIRHAVRWCRSDDRPFALFYVVLGSGFRGVSSSALAWSYVALARRSSAANAFLRCVSSDCPAGPCTVVSFITGTPSCIFGTPFGNCGDNVVLVGSAVIGRPFPRDSPILPDRSGILPTTCPQFFIRISLLWATFDAQLGNRPLLTRVVLLKAFRSRADGRSTSGSDRSGESSSRSPALSPDAPGWIIVKCRSNREPQPALVRV